MLLNRELLLTFSPCRRRCLHFAKTKIGKAYKWFDITVPRYMSCLIYKEIMDVCAINVTFQVANICNSAYLLIWKMNIIRHDSVVIPPRSLMVSDPVQLEFCRNKTYCELYRDEWFYNAAGCFLAVYHKLLLLATRIPSLFYVVYCFRIFSDYFVAILNLRIYAGKVEFRHDVLNCNNVERFEEQTHWFMVTTWLWLHI